MSDRFKDDFKGTGSLQKFVEESTKLFRAMNDVVVIVPQGYSGVEPIMSFNGKRMVFDMGEALVFTLNNVDWNFSGDATIADYSVEVSNGQLVIDVEANNTP